MASSYLLGVTLPLLPLPHHGSECTLCDILWEYNMTFAFVQALMCSVLSLPSASLLLFKKWSEFVCVCRSARVRSFTPCPNCSGSTSSCNNWLHFFIVSLLKDVFEWNKMLVCISSSVLSLKRCLLATRQSEKHTIHLHWAGHVWD